MARRFLVMGDNHGDTASLERVLEDVDGETFDFAVHVGDFTRAYRGSREQGVRDLAAVEPLLAEIDDLARHGLLWVYGNQDYFGNLDYDLSVGTEVPAEGCISVGGQRFTNSPAAVDDDVILVTHVEKWSLLDHFEGLAHFCGNTHRGRHLDRRLNSSFLRLDVPEEGIDLFGGYFVVTLGEDGRMDVEMRSVGSLERTDCSVHGERGVQFLPATWDCMYCSEPRNLWREMAATGFYGLTDGDDDATVEREALVEYAAGLWDDPPADFRTAFDRFLADVDEDRYALLTATNDGLLTVAERSYAY